MATKVWPLESISKYKPNATTFVAQTFIWLDQLFVKDDKVWVLKYVCSLYFAIEGVWSMTHAYECE